MATRTTAKEVQEVPAEETPQVDALQLSKEMLNKQGIVEYTDPATGMKRQMRFEDASNRKRELESITEELAASGFEEETPNE